MKSSGQDRNRVRIIGGAWRSRVLRFPAAPGLRPTPDRVRETVFNWLGQRLDGRRCLDLCAGSGAFGFEAASRGAARVVMVEAAPLVVAALQENARLLCAAAVQVARGDALQFVQNVREEFDVAFVDPPYDSGLLAPLLELLPRCLAQDGVVYFESGGPFSAAADWRVIRRGRAGAVHFQLAILSGEKSGNDQSSLRRDLRSDDAGP